MYIYVRLSVSVCLSMHMYDACDPLFLPLFPRMDAILSSHFRVEAAKEGSGPHRPLCNLWLISPLESWAVAHLGERNVMPQNYFL